MADLFESAGTWTGRPWRVSSAAPWSWRSGRRPPGTPRNRHAHSLGTPCQWSSSRR